MIPHPGIGDPPDIVVYSKRASCHYLKTGSDAEFESAIYICPAAGPSPNDYRSNTIALTAGMMALATPAEAQENKWCSRMNGATSCMYQTKQQCRAAISGRGARASAGVVRGRVHRKALLVHLMFEALDYLASEHRMARRGRPHSQSLQLYLGQILKDRNHRPASSQGTGQFICVRLDQSIRANATIAFRRG
jgi:uncharacterized protein DUF3551